MSTPSISNSGEASDYLNSLLNKTLHIHISDGRMFVGQMKCTDNERNVILAVTHEYRKPSQKDVQLAAAKYEKDGREGSGVGDGKFRVDMKKRFVGLVVVPGRYIEKVEVEE